MAHAMTRCCICMNLLSHSRGQRMEIDTEAKLNHVKRLLGKDVSVGYFMCGTCRSRFYKRKSDEMQKELEEESEEGAGPSHGRRSPDPTFHYIEHKPAELIEMPFPRVVSSHAYCFLCRSTKDIVVVPMQSRQQIFSSKRIFVPKGNRCCRNHLIKKRFYEDELNNIRIYSTTSTIDVSDLKNFLEQLAVRSEAELADKIGDYTLSEERLKVFTGLSWENIIELRSMLPSLHESQSRTATQALVTFLFKFRTGNSNKVIASTLGLQREQQVSEFSNSVIHSFEADILPSRLGFKAKSRELLIEHETSRMAQKLHDIHNRLALIFDGTYITHQKSSNNEYQRRSYSGQKKKSLCKPFTICTTNGYIVDTLGPYSADKNDASIMEDILKDPNGLRSLMKPGDICIVDRGFRDVREQLTSMGYSVLMPALKGKRKQLPTSESNESRFVTKIRWAVEAIHGILGEKYNLLHQQVDNKLLPKMQAYCRIASFLNNQFGKRLDSDAELMDDIVSQMNSQKCTENSLAKEIEEGHLGRRTVPFQDLSSVDIDDFPEMSVNELKIFFTGSYQLKQAISYLAEVMDSENNIQMGCLRETPNIIKIEIRSRHIKSKTYKCFIDYQPNSSGYSGIKRHYCECANGNRTVGCCSHIAAVVYYLSHARYLSRIIRPAEILSKLFIQDDIPTVINEDSDED